MFSSYGRLIEEGKFIANAFVVFNVSHIKRHGNFVTHNLAKHVSDFSM